MKSRSMIFLSLFAFASGGVLTSCGIDVDVKDRQSDELSASSGSEEQEKVSENAASSDAQSETNLLERLRSRDNFTTLVAAIEAAELTEVLSGDRRLTIFAPTNNAFSALPDGALATLLQPESKQQLRELILLHTVPEALEAKDVLQRVSLQSAAGIPLEVDGETITINGSKITETDLIAKNGVIHTIDSVLRLPEQDHGGSEGSAEEPTSEQGPNTLKPSLADLVSKDPNFSTLLTALELAGLTSVLEEQKNLTVFAPPNTAFEALPADKLAQLLDPNNKEALKSLLLYHVVPGLFDAASVLASGSLTTASQKQIKVDAEAGTVSGSRIITTNLEASNGIVHVIQDVMVPPNPNSKSLIDILANQPRFSTLVTAIEAAELGSILGDGREFTIFAPTNKAFAALGTSSADLLSEPKYRERLKGILLQHVVVGRFASADVLSSQALSTAAEGVQLSVDSVNLRVGGATLVQTDVKATNGIIHVIDSVIVHPE